MTQQRLARRALTLKETCALPRRTAVQWGALVVSGCALALLLFATLAGLLVPRLIGGVALQVPDRTMSPGLNIGDVVVVRTVTPDQACGGTVGNRVVAYQPVSGVANLALGRVTSKSVGHFADNTRCRLTITGDNPTAPETTISPLQVRGALFYKVPGLGAAHSYAQTHHISTYAAAGALALCAYTATTPKKPTLTNPRKPQPKAAQLKPNTVKQTPTPKPSFRAQSLIAIESSARKPAFDGEAIEAIKAKGTPSFCAELAEQAESQNLENSPLSRQEILRNRAAQIRIHEIALREARISYREAQLAERERAFNKQTIDNQQPPEQHLADQHLIDCYPPDHPKAEQQATNPENPHSENANPQPPLSRRQRRLASVALNPAPSAIEPGLLDLASSGIDLTPSAADPTPWAIDPAPSGTETPTRADDGPTTPGVSHDA